MDTTKLDAIIGRRVRYVRNGKTFYRALPGEGKEEPKKNNRRKTSRENKSVAKSRKGRVGVATAIALSVLGVSAVGTAVALGVGSNKKDKRSLASVYPPSFDFPNAPNPPQPDLPRKNPLLGEDLALPAARERRKNQTQEINSNDPWDRKPNEAIVVKGKQEKLRPQLMPDIGHELGYEGNETSLVPERKGKTPDKRERTGDPYPKRNPRDPEVQAYQRDLHRIGKNKDIDAFERDLQVFEAYQQHFPDEANMLKFYEVSRAIAEPLQRESKKGRPLKKYSGVIEFVNRNATSAYQKSPTGYSDYMTIDPSVDSVGKYRQFLERMSKASRQPTAKIYDRLERNYAIGYENKGLDKTEARQRSQETVRRIFGDIESHKQDLDKAIQERIDLIDRGRIIYLPNEKGKGGNFYDTGFDLEEPTQGQVIKNARNIVEVLNRPLVTREQLQESFKRGLRKGFERRMVKEQITEAVKGIWDEPMIDRVVDILGDIDSEVLRTKSSSLAGAIFDLPDIIEESIQEMGDKDVGRREFLDKTREIILRRSNLSPEKQIELIAADPKRITRTLAHYGRTIQYRIAQVLEQPEQGFMVRKTFLERLLRPLGSKYTIRRSLELARLKNQIEKPLAEYARENTGLRNPVSRRSQLEYEDKIRGHLWKATRKGARGFFDKFKESYKRDSDDFVLYCDTFFWVLAG